MEKEVRSRDIYNSQPERTPQRSEFAKQERLSRERASRVGRRGIEAFESSVQARIDENDIILRERFGDRIPMSKFVGLYSANRVLRDQEYTIERAEGQRTNEASRAAKLLEKFFIAGVNTGGWLGVESIRPDGDYEVHARQTTKYDDISHRIDAMVDLKLRDPLESEDGKEVLKNLTIGFDVTTDPTRSRIYEKLTKHYSDSTRLPFGLSHVDYHFDGENYDAAPMVPRYVIGLSEKEIERVSRRENLLFDRQGRPRALKPFSKETLFTRFKVLDEIRQQNLLYIAMLPDDRADNPTLQLADLQFSAVDSCLHTALIDCATAIRNKHIIPEYVFTENARRKKPLSEREVIRQYAQFEDLRQPGRQGIRRRSSLVTPYSRIISCAKEIEAAAYAAEDSPEYRMVAPFRAIMAHKEGFELPAKP